MFKDDLLNLNNAYLKVLNEDVGLGPQADSQQGLSPTIQTIIKSRQCSCAKCNGEENCEDCGGACGCDNNAMPSNDRKEEIDMAKSELYNTINHAVSLYKKLDSVNKLEAWVSAKITKAADYLNSIKHYLDHEEVGSEEINSEQNEEIDLIRAFDKGSNDLLSTITSILSRESKQNLEKVLFEVVQLIEKKS
jgi:hypothetical protein